MATNQKKAVIFAPFWSQTGHVGNNRVDRFVRWLAEGGIYVTVVRAGSKNDERQEFWGKEVTVRDYLGLYQDNSAGTAHLVLQNPNKLRLALTSRLFNPDSTVIWARVAARDSRVLRALEGAAFILSSSPPESAHVGAWILSRRSGVPHIVDMRDGWLDEPLKPLLRTSALRRWLEGRLETRILQDAQTIQVTSEVWKELLSERYPTFSSKIKVLTNGYPLNQTVLEPKQQKRANNELVLIHSGRFLGSDPSRTPSLLLEPLLRNLSKGVSKGVIRLIGPLSVDELKIVGMFHSRFEEIGWRVECPGSLPREELLGELPKADGLLLLSTSNAAIPSKLFEYLPTGIPILAITTENSAVWKLLANIPQAFLDDYCRSFSDENVVSDFMAWCRKPGERCIPVEFDEEHLKMKFLDTLSCY